MSILTKTEILERVEKKNIGFSPNLDAFQVQGHAIDLRLGFTFLVPKTWHITAQGRESISIDYLKEKESGNSRIQNFDVIELEEGQTFDLLPHEYILAATLESVKIPNDLMAVLYPRSSTNRRGLSVDLTGIVDAGYEGQLVIPITNNTHSQTIRLYPGERFCQIVFETLSKEIEMEKSRYHRKDIIEGFIKKNPEKANKDNTELSFITKGKIRDLKKQHPSE